MWRAVAFGAALVIVAWSLASRADIIPEPSEGNRYIQRTLSIDPSALPEGARVSVSVSYGKTRTEVDNWPLHRPLPDPASCDATLVVSPPLLSCHLPLPPLTEAKIGADPRVKLQARYRPEIVDGQLEPGPIEVVFFDEFGAVVCRRLPIDDALDPCDVDAPWKRVAYYGRRYLLVPAFLLLLLAGAWLIARLRQQRAGRARSSSG